MAVCTEEALEVIRPVSKDGRNVERRLCPAKDALGYANLMSGPIRCFKSLVETSMVLEIGI